MGKIKVIFAEVNDDDDLVPGGKAPISGDLKTVAQFREAIKRHLRQDRVIEANKDFFRRNYEVGNDNGKLTITNFPSMCSTLATIAMECMISVYALDIVDEVYYALESWLTNILCIEYDSYMSEIIKDLEGK